MIRAIAIIAVLLNIVAMGAWILLNPPAAYERSADRDMRAAHEAFRKSGPERAYALYRKIVTDYGRSSFADEARFYAARTAFLGLGQFAEAEKELAAYLDAKPRNEEHKLEAEEYLGLIRNRADLPEDQRDAALWEYVQALLETGNGRHREASVRLDKLTTTFKTTALGLKAAALKDDVETRLRELESK